MTEMMRLSTHCRIVKASLLALGLLAASPAATAFAQDLEGTHPQNGGTLTIRSSPHGGVQLLRSFYYRFLNSDHHISNVDVRTDTPSPAQTEIVFMDENGDDPYAYHMQHADVFTGDIFTGSTGEEICRGGCSFPIARPSGDYVFVLRGFAFRFLGSGDHHMKQFEISENSGNILVRFQDENTGSIEDNIAFTVDYAYVPRIRFAALGTVSGRASGAQGRPIPFGTSVIRGFNFRYVSGDHHIDEMGVFQWGAGSVDAYWNDDNNDDSFDWYVDWGIL